MIAASIGHGDVVGYLMDHGADSTIRCQGGNALYYATMCNHLEVVKVLTQKGMDINGSCTDSGYTALMLTSLGGDAAIVEYLLGHPSLGCIDARNRYGNTALHYSCDGGRDIQITKQLLEAGADPRITEIHGITALQRAVLHNHHEVVLLLKVCMFHKGTSISRLLIIFPLTYNRLLCLTLSVVECCTRPSSWVMLCTQSTRLLRRLQTSGPEEKRSERW